MAETSVSFHSFNRGRISRLALARTDIKRTSLSAETMTNWMPRVLGSMMLRPGLKYLGSTKDNLLAKFIPFVFSTDDTALIEVTEFAFRVWVDDEVISRPAVTAAVTNGSFTTDLTGWTDNDEAGATSAWKTGGFMSLIGTGTAFAIRDQQVTVNQIGTLHALDITIENGPVTFRVGTAVGLDDYFSEAELGTGEHSLSFTPTGASFWIRFKSSTIREKLVNRCIVAPAGDMEIGAPWPDDDLRSLRWDQSGDVLFIAARRAETNLGWQQVRIERRNTTSWSLILYQPPDGPFLTENLGPITMTPSALNGNITVTASQPYFKSTNAGGLMRLTSSGQIVTSSISAQNTFTSSIRVSGVGTSRAFTITLNGTWSATVTLQRSIIAPGTWEDVGTYIANQTISFNDGLDNQVIYYRIGVKTGNYSSGTVIASLAYTLGGIDGVVRFTAFTSSTVMQAEVVSDLGGTGATAIWAEGAWSYRRGFPSSVSFYEGRLWWAGQNGVYGSVSDAFDSFDPNYEGDAGPINRTIGSGPVDDINFLLPLQRLVIGAEGAEMSIRSTTFDEPLTPSNFNIKTPSTMGSRDALPVKIDNRGAFVQRSGNRVYELSFDANAYDYMATDLTALVPEVGEPGILMLGVQRQPDTRIHAVKSDGTVAVSVQDPAENVLAWLDVETEGEIEDVVVLPGDEEDQVYYLANRIVEGVVTALAIAAFGAGQYDPDQTPTLTIAGDGSGATGSATFKVASIAFSAAGTGYVANDILELEGGAYTTPFTIRVDSVNGSGAILTYTVLDYGSYTTLPPDDSPYSGGTGTGARIGGESYDVSSVTLIAGGSGYSSATVTVDGEANIPATITATIDDIGGRYLEKWALESACRGGDTNKQADSFVEYSGTPTNIISGLDHLDGRRVIVWADAQDLSPDDENGDQETYLVTSGSISLAQDVSEAIVGLPYDSRWKSTKLSFDMQVGTWLNQRKNIPQIGVIMADTHAKGLKFGPDFDHLDDLPGMENGVAVETDSVWENYDKDFFPFPGTWDTDCRVCLQGRAPRPVTLLAVSVAIQENDKT